MARITFISLRLTGRAVPEEVTTIRPQEKPDDGPPTFPNPDWTACAKAALDEDEAAADVTTQLLVQTDRKTIGRLIAEGSFVVAGLPIVAAAIRCFEPAEVQAGEVGEGEWAAPGRVLASVCASSRTLLGAERVVLNYLQRLCGIATATRRAVESVSGTGAAIMDTRKTTPGLRLVEKYAVRVGGGVNHRFSLADAVLWKDNHWALLRRSGESLGTALARAPRGLLVEVEVESEEQLELTIAAGIRYILVDNQPPEVIARWAAHAGPDVVIEASGGITIDRLRAYAEAGAHRISVGALTHSFQAAPIRMEID